MPSPIAPEMRPALPSFQVGTPGRKSSSDFGGLMVRFAYAFLSDSELGVRRNVHEMVPSLVTAKIMGKPEPITGEKWRTTRTADSQDILAVQRLVEGVPSDPALWEVVTEVASAADRANHVGDTIGVRGSVGMVAAFVNYALQQEGTPLQAIDADIMASAREALLPTGEDELEVAERRQSALWSLLSGRNAIKRRLEDEYEFGMLQVVDSALNIYKGWSQSFEDATTEHHREDLAIVTYLTIVDAQLRRNRAAKAPVPLF